MNKCEVRAAPSTSRVRLCYTPSITADTKECTGLMEATTLTSAYANVMLDESIVVARTS